VTTRTSGTSGEREDEHEDRGDDHEYEDHDEFEAEDD
jgi:hypothetical protein